VAFVATDNNTVAEEFQRLLEDKKVNTIASDTEAVRIHSLYRLSSQHQWKLGLVRSFADFFILMASDILLMTQMSTWNRDAGKYYRNTMVPILQISEGSAPDFCKLNTTTSKLTLGDYQQMREVLSEV
jgi:hypothetical protein